MAVKKVRNKITPSLDRQIREAKKVPKKAHDFWKSITPKRTGNARNKTRFSGNKIRADYKYATVLDKGSSRQARRGMVEPTREYITKLLKKILRK